MPSKHLEWTWGDLQKLTADQRKMLIREAKAQESNQLATASEEDQLSYLISRPPMPLPERPLEFCLECRWSAEKLYKEIKQLQETVDGEIEAAQVIIDGDDYDPKERADGRKIMAEEFQTWLMPLAVQLERALK